MSAIEMSLGADPILTCTELLIVGVVAPGRPAALAVTLKVAYTADSRAVKVRTTIGDGWTDDFMVRDSSALAGSTATEDVDVLQTS